MNDENQNPFRPPSFNPESVNEDANKKKSDFENGSKLVTLAEFDNSLEAHALKDMLAINGIESRVTNESMAASLGFLAGTSSSFSPSVMILESDAEAALAIKQEFLAADVAEATTIPEWTCSCGETVDEGFEVCWNCGSLHADSQ